MMLIKDRFVNRLEDTIWDVLLPAKKQDELRLAMDNMAYDMAKFSVGQKVDLLVSEILKLIPEKILMEIDKEE
jgi:hypothetical protein